MELFLIYQLIITLSVVSLKSLFVNFNIYTPCLNSLIEITAGLVVSKLKQPHNRPVLSNKVAFDSKSSSLLIIRSCCNDLS